MSRPKVDYRTTSKEAYDRFCKTHPNVNVTFKQFRNVIISCNEMIRDYILETGDKFKLPFGFGELSINKWRPKKYVEYNGQRHINLPVDWGKTRKLGTKVYHTNAHTDGFRFQWIWFRIEARFECAKCFVFNPMRETSRKLKTYIKKPNSVYQHIYKEWNPKR